MLGIASKLKDILLNLPNATFLLPVILAVIMFLSSFGLSWYISEVSTDESKSLASEQLQQLAYEVSDKIDRDIDERMRDVQMMSRTPALREASPLVRYERIMKAFSDTYRGQYVLIGVTDAQGRIIASRDKNLRGMDVSDRPWFKEAENASDKKVITEDIKASVLLPGLRGMNIFMPIYGYDDKFKGVVITKLNLAWIDGMRVDVAKRSNLVSGSWILDKNNRILLGDKKSEIGKKMDISAAKLALEGKRGSTRDYLPDTSGQQLVGYYGSNGFGSYPGHGWKIIVAEPTNAAFARTEQNAASLRLVGGIYSGFISLVTAIIIWRLLQRRKRLEEAQANFISLASHQLRSPATAVKAQLDLIVDGFVTSKEEVDETIKDAYESNEVQLQIIDDLLNITAMEEGRLELELEDADIGELVQSALHGQIILKNPKQRINVELPEKKITARVDKVKIKMAIGNLISNAIKYTPEDGIIEIKLYKKNQNIRIAVKDNGIGIPAKDMGKLFTRFGRLKNARGKRIQGSGLGLYIAKRIMDLHGGCIHVKSQAGKGSAFMIEFPIKSPGNNR